MSTWGGDEMDQILAPVRLKRRRRSPDEAREQALASARKILLAEGPAGVTLSAVAQDIGVTHSVLSHHFGSVAQLQSALMGAMVRDLATALAEAVAHVRSDVGGPKAMVDIIFNSFDTNGAGQLAAWIALSDRFEHLEPVRHAVNHLVDAVNEKVGAPGGDTPRHIPSALLFIALCAVGDSLIGEPLHAMLGRDRHAVRRIATRLLPSFLSAPLSPPS